MSGADAQARWAAQLVAGFVDAGVRDVVVSPGSRHAPLVLAAAARGELELYPVVDERAASFFALGLARVTGRPPLLLCTSGTAGAHYLPAVVEASRARLPLLALTADRPPELHGRGASQTVEQGFLYGAHARAFVELGAAPADEAPLRAARRTAALAAAAAASPEPGPVHLNARLRKPLEPPASAPGADAHGERAARAYPARRAPDEAAVGVLADAIRASRRGLVLCGPAPLAHGALAEAAAALSDATGMPLLAEAGSQLRLTGREDGHRCDGFDALLGSEAWLERHRPDLVVRLGAAPVSMGWSRAAPRLRGTPVWVVGAPGWSDPDDLAAGLVEGDAALVLASLAGRLAGGVEGRDERDAWRRAWCSAGAELMRVAAGETAAADEPLEEPAALRAAVAAAPPGSLVALGNSLPVRLVDAACPGSLARVGILHQRGASGIDGQVAGAAGAAAAAPRRGAAAVTALVGDVGFAHDLGGLACARHAHVPLVVVVLRNEGGRLFELLPIGRRDDLAEPFERLFLTPPGVDVGAAAAACGASHARAETAGELTEALRGAHGRAGATVVEAVVGPASARRLLGRLAEAADALAR